MALYNLYCADVPLRNCSLTHSGVSLSSDKSTFPCALLRSLTLGYKCSLHWRIGQYLAFPLFRFMIFFLGLRLPDGRTSYGVRMKGVSA